MSRVLITGGGGFIGRHCLPFLCERDMEVHAVTSPRRSLEGLPQGPRIVWHQADLLDNKAVSSLVEAVRPTHLLHLAWHTTPIECWTSDANLDWIASSLHLLRCVVEAGGRRVVMTGSCAEYDWSAGLCSEAATPLVPTTLYGSCKQALFQVSGAFADKHDIEWSWGRIFYVYGPHEHRQRLVPSVICSLLHKQKAICSQGRHKRDFLYVEDVARALVCLLDSQVTGAVNIGSGTALAIRDLALSIGEQLGSPELVQLGAEERPDGESPLVVADITRLKSEIGFSPRFDIATGIGESIDWWRRELSAVTAR